MMAGRLFVRKARERRKNGEGLRREPGMNVKGTKVRKGTKVWDGTKRESPREDANERESLENQKTLRIGKKPLEES